MAHDPGSLLFFAYHETPDELPLASSSPGVLPKLVSVIIPTLDEDV
jgi:hypothetical protein